MVLSIITVTFNGRAHATRCVASVAEAAPMGGDYEHLVVDNASQDGVAQALEGWGGRVRVLRQERNLGFARAANVGMRAARGAYLLLLNPDCVLPAGAAEGLVSFMEEHPRVGAASPMLVTPEGCPQISYARFPRLVPHLLGLSPLGWVVPARLKDVGFSGIPPSVHETAPRPVDAPAGSCLLVRREVFEQTGGMDERFFTYYEDIDWAYRMASLGWERYYVPSVRVIHDMGGCWRDLPKELQIARSYEGKYLYFGRRHGCLAGGLVRAVTVGCARLNLILGGLLISAGLGGARWADKVAFNRTLLEAHRRYHPRWR